MLSKEIYISKFYIIGYLSYGWLLIGVFGLDNVYAKFETKISDSIFRWLLGHVSHKLRLQYKVEAEGVQFDLRRCKCRLTQLNTKNWGKIEYLRAQISSKPANILS